jgi:acyl dehydratase
MVDLLGGEAGEITDEHCAAGQPFGAPLAHSMGRMPIAIALLVGLGFLGGISTAFWGVEKRGAG